MLPWPTTRRSCTCVQTTDSSQPLTIRLPKLVIAAGQKYNYASYAASSLARQPARLPGNCALNSIQSRLVLRAFYGRFLSSVADMAEVVPAMKRRRRPRWSESEQRVLLEEVKANQFIFLKKLCTTVSNLKKKRIWMDVANRVRRTDITNDRSVTDRTALAC